MAAAHTPRPIEIPRERPLTAARRRDRARLTAANRLRRVIEYRRKLQTQSDAS